MTWVCAACDAEVEAESRDRPAWCPCCLRSGVLVRPVRRRVSEAIGAATKPLSAAAIVAASWDLQQCPVTGLAWSSGAMFLLYGPPGSGKSTLALQIAAQLGPVTVAALEEAAGPPMARRLVLAEMGRRQDVHIHARASLQDLLAAASAGHCIVIDSISLSALQPTDLRGIVQAGCPLLLGVLHATKSGDARGSLSLIHECDVVVQVENGAWQTRKNRYGPSGLTGTIRGVHPSSNSKESN